MDDLKSTYREGENKTKEAMRKADGEEDLGDKLGNLGDDIRQGLGNAGDDLREGVDTAGDDVDRARRNNDGDMTNDRL
jgi:hypothetical protein